MELEQYRDLAWGTALAILGDYHLAEDAVQDAFVEAYRSWDRLERPDARAAWMRAIVRHRCYRLLRQRDMGVGSLPDMALEEEPWMAASRNEQRQDLFARVRQLPRPLREVVVLHHLRGCSHKAVADFLDVPTSTVNNRLHRARQLLKEEPMNFDVSEAGTVIAQNGPIVDVRFAPEATPDLFDAIAAGGAAPSLRVVQVRDEGMVRCVATGDVALRVGQDVVNKTANGGTYVAAVTPDDQLAAVVSTIGEPCSGLRETGIKPVDFFCPLPERGSVALFGTSGTGKVVMTMELMERLGGSGPQLFYLADRSEPALIRDLRDQGDTFHRDVVWLTSERVTDPEFAATTDLFDTRIYCSPLLGARFLWPAVDPFHSESRADRTKRHASLVSRARDLLSRARTLTHDPVFLEYLACRSIGAAKRRLATANDRMATLGNEERATVERARRLEAFLTNPFDVAEELTGKKGEVVALSDTLDGVEAILDGACDNAPVENLSYIGALS